MSVQQKQENMNVEENHIHETEPSKSIVELIKRDHRILKAYYNKYKESNKHDDKWFNLFVWEAARHSVAEELSLFPIMIRLGVEGEELANASRREHHALKESLEEVGKKKDPVLMDKMFEHYMDHMHQEEIQDLAFVEKELTEDELSEAGKLFEARKMFASTRPHPSIPSKSAGWESFLDFMIMPIDKLRDAWSKFPNQQDIKMAQDAMQ